MEHLILVERDALDANARVVDARLLRFASARSAEGGWRAEVLRLAGLARLADCGVAEIARYALDPVDDAADDPGDEATIDSSGGGLFAGRAACFATPVHVQIGRYGGRLQRESLLALSASELDELLQAFVADAPTENCSLRVLPDGGLMAFITPPGEVRTLDPEACIDVPIDSVLPQGPGGARLQRVVTELEIWLYPLPLNRARALRGAPPLTSFWLWGLGASPGANPDARLDACTAGRALSAPARGVSVLTAPGALHVFSRDAFLCGMGRLVGATMHDDARCTIDDMLSSGATRVIAAAADGLGAAIDAVRDGRIGRLDVVSAQSVLHLKRSDLYKFWRRIRAS